MGQKKKNDYNIIMKFAASIPFIIDINIKCEKEF